MKWPFLAVLLAFLTLNAFGQSNVPIPVIIPSTAVAPTNTMPPAPPIVMINPDGSIAVNGEADVLLKLLPAKYRTALLLALILTPWVTKAIHTYKAGGNTTAAAAAVFLGKSQSVVNEIAQLKQRTGLPLVPAPPAPDPKPVVPVVAPVVPLTSLPAPVIVPVPVEPPKP